MTIMKVRIQVVIEDAAGHETEIVEEVGCLQRGDLLPETLGMTLDEGKQLLVSMQRCLVQQQVEAYIAQQRHCGDCGRQHMQKDQKTITMRTVFGQLRLESPRFYACPCRREPEQSFSPLAQKLPERTTPELKYLQTKWASLMSYGLTVSTATKNSPIMAR